MIDYLIRLDIRIFELLNSINSPFFDVIMYYVSNRFIWIPLYLFFIIFFIVKYKTRSIYIILTIILLIIFTDQLSVHLFKNIFERLRPCHNPMLADKIHLVNNYCGGKYGFVSSHAANSFAFAIITSLFLKNRIVFWILLIWASIISYSRIYLGLHFPLDVSVGALFGIFSAILFYKICNLIIRRNNKDN